MAQMRQHDGQLRVLSGLRRTSVVLAQSLLPAFVFRGYCISLAFVRFMHSLAAA